MTSDSQRTHLDSDLGSWDFTGGSQDPHRRGDSSRPGRPHPRGSSTSPRPCVHPSRQRELAMSSPSRQHIPHGSTLTSCPSPHCRVRALKGYCSEGATVGRAAWPGPLGLEQDRAAPSWLGDRPRKDAGRPFSSWSDLTHTSQPARLSFPHHRGPRPLCCPGAAEAWLAPVSVPVQAWVAAPQAGTRFLPFFPDKAGQQVVCHSGGSSWSRPPQPETLSPHLCREEGGGERPELSAGPTPAGGSRPGASLSFSLPRGARPAQPWAPGSGHGACWSRPACASLDVGGSGTSLGWAVCRYLTSRMDGLVSMMATTILSM